MLVYPSVQREVRAAVPSEPDMDFGSESLTLTTWFARGLFKHTRQSTPVGVLLPVRSMH